MHSASMLSILLLSLTGPVPVLAGMDIASLFSEKQIFSALQGAKAILVHPEKATSSLMIVSISLTILFVFIVYIFSKKKKTDIIPDIKKYEQQFEEEYRNFVSEIDEPDKDTNYIPEDTPAREDK